VPGDRVQLGNHTRLKYLSRGGDGLGHQTAPPKEWPLNDVPTRSGIKVRHSPE
jgi:hypothetical protein